MKGRLVRLYCVKVTFIGTGQVRTRVLVGS